MLKPDFMIIGAAKSGTTALYKYLDKHDGVYFPKEKEPHYFVPEYVKKELHYSVKTEAEYFEMFEDAKKGQILGEASVLYMPLHDVSADSIKNRLGDIKIIVILRHPLDRALSAYNHSLRYNSAENLGFNEAVLANDYRKQNHYNPMLCYKWLSSYAEQIETFKQTFSKVCVVFSEQLKATPQTELSRLCSFLGITDLESIDTVRANEAGFVWKSNFFRRLVNTLFPGRLRYMIRTKAPRFYASLKKVTLKGFATKQKKDGSIVVTPEVKAIFDDEVKKLELLLGSDISCWKKDE